MRTWINVICTTFHRPHYECISLHSQMLYVFFFCELMRVWRTADPLPQDRNQLQMLVKIRLRYIYIIHGRRGYNATLLISDSFLQLITASRTCRRTERLPQMEMTICWMGSRRLRHGTAQNFQSQDVARREASSADSGSNTWRCHSTWVLSSSRTWKRK